MTTILLHSGGLDSHIAWLMNPTWQPVYVRHGAPQEAQELKALAQIRKVDEDFNPVIVRAADLKAEWDGHIFYRNMLLLTTALAHFPKADAVAYGALLGEATGDKSRAFRKSLEKTWRLSEGRRVRVLTPLGRMTKAQALRKAYNYDGAEALTLTVSCYTNQLNECGECQACFRRGVAEYLCDVRDTPPPFPVATDGVWANLKRTPVTRWPSLALANLDVVRAHLKHRAALWTGE